MPLRHGYELEARGDFWTVMLHGKDVRSGLKSGADALSFAVDHYELTTGLLWEPPYN